MSARPTFLLQLASHRRPTCSAGIDGIRRLWHMRHRMLVKAKDSSEDLRDCGLDRTLADTFPCSDPLSSIPNPACDAGAGVVKSTYYE
jgi:hypothetical protein